MGSSLGDEILKNNSGSNIGVSELLLSGTQALVKATLIQKERDEFLETIKKQTGLGLGAGQYIENVLKKNC